MVGKLSRVWGKDATPVEPVLCSQGAATPEPVSWPAAAPRSLHTAVKTGHSQKRINKILRKERKGPWGQPVESLLSA